MSLSQHWVLKVFGRVLTNAIVSGVVIAIIGALCVATAGALLGWILDIRSTPAIWDGGFFGAGLFLGLCLGAWSGILGALVGGVAASKARPGALLAPLSVLKRVALGQLLGTLAALSSYLIFALAVAQLNAQPFVGTVEDNLDLAICGVPVLMNCGAIAGALWKRDSGR